MIISATILAAGRSSRMGDENKLLLPLNGDFVINRICHTVLNSGLKPVIVVTGFQHTQIEKALPKMIDHIANQKTCNTGNNLQSGIARLD